MAKFLVVGDIYSEKQFFVNTIPIENEFSVAAEVITLTGSKTINTARVLSRLGNVVDFYAKTGNDSYLDTVLNDFKRYGINSDLVKAEANQKTGQLYVTTNSQGESAISIYFGANAFRSESEIASLGSILKNYALTYSSTNLNLSSLYKLVEISQLNKVPLFLDFPTQHKSVNLLKLKDVDFISPNRQEAEMIFDTKIRSIDEALNAIKMFRKFCKGTIILTLDSDGCALLKKGENEPIYFKTNKVNTIDTTGAGDIFKGIFVSEYIKHSNLELAIMNAQTIASRSVQIAGIDNTLNNLDLTF